jgi:hypothetical protein
VSILSNASVNFNIQTKRVSENIEKYGGSLRDAVKLVVGLALEHAKEEELPHIRTKNLYNSIRSEIRVTGKEITTANIRMGGLGTTFNASGQDYAFYHEGDFKILTNTLQWVRDEGLNEAVQLSLTKLRF